MSVDSEGLLVSSAVTVAANTMTLGGVIIGDGIKVDTEGRISVNLPTKVSQLTNDKEYQTKEEVSSSISNHNADKNAHSEAISKAVEAGINSYNTANFKNRLRPGLARNKTYSVGDICFHDSLPSYAYLECITAGTTAETEQDFGGGRASDRLTDGTAVFIVRDMRCKYRTGQIITIWGTPAEYDYLLLCDGSQISAELYPELVKVLGGNTLPNLIDGKFLEGYIQSGVVFGPGLPNISGAAGPYFTSDYGQSGALYTTYQSVKNLGGGSPASYFNIVLDAHASNSIYGSSTTVQPYAMTVKYYICYAG